MKSYSPKSVNDESFNVLAYGAKGDNSNNDSTGIQKALDAAFAAGGGEVVAPKGIYRIIDAPLRIRSNVKLRLQPGAEFHRYSDFSSMIWNGDGSQNRSGWNGHGDIVMEGGVFDMRCTTATKSLSSDAFPRSNTTAPHTLGVADSGQTWIDESQQSDNLGTLGIVSNTVFAPSSGLHMCTLYGWADGTVSCTIPTVGEGGITFRASSQQQRWEYRRDASGNAQLSYFTSTGLSTTENIVTPTATTAVTAGATLKVIFVGNRIRAFVGSTMTHDTTDTPGYTANRKVGLVAYDTTVRLDSFANTSQSWTDNFTRSNSTTSLGTASSGGTWTTRAGTLGINTNTAYAPSGGTGNIATIDATQETNVEVTMPTVGNAGVVFRYSDTSNYWYAVRHTDGNIRVGKVVAGVDTPMTADTPTAVSAGNTITVKLMGKYVRAYVGSTLTHEDIDSHNYQAIGVGVIFHDGTARLSNFDAYAASGTDKSGAGVNFGHGENILFRDLIIRDTSANSHAIEIAGCKNVLVDNCTFEGMAFVSGRISEAFQMDVTKGSTYFAAFGPHDHTTCRDVVVRGSSFTRSYMPGTQAWDRGIGSHSSTIGKWHDHLRVVDNYFDCGAKAVRAYNWNNVFIRGNTISSGSGIEVRTVDITDTEDTKNTAGTQTSAAQDVNNTQIEGNIVTCDVAANSNTYAIQTWGATGGSCRGVVIRGNDIRSTTCGGIMASGVVGAVIDDNIVNSLATSDTGFHGIKIEGTDVLVSGNSVYRVAGNGVYITTSGTSKVRVMNNFVKGANRGGTSTTAAFKNDSTLDDIVYTGNVVRLWGSGNEITHSLYVSNGTNISHAYNDFVTGTVSDVNMGGTETSPIIYRAGSSTAIGTTLTDVGGLTMTLPVGDWNFTAWVPMVPVGSPTALSVRVTGPTASAHSYSIKRFTATAIAVANDTGTTFPNTDSALTQTSTILVEVEGTCTVTTAGTLKISMTRTGGTSNTAQAGSYLRATRVY